MRTWIKEGKTSVDIEFTKSKVIIEVKNDDKQKSSRPIKVYVGDEFNGGSEAGIVFKQERNSVKNYNEWKTKPMKL